MRRFLPFLTAIVFVSPLFGQQVKKEKFDDIINLFIDEKYDKCFDKAYMYTQSDKHKKHPLPYVYCSMSTFEMSRSEKFMEKFPKALKDAMKYAVKFKKKNDKYLAKNPDSEDYMAEYSDFFADLRKTMIEAAEGDFDSGLPNKAIRYYKYLTGMDPTDHAAWFMKGLCEFKMKATSEGLKSMEAGKKDFDGEATIEEMNKEQKHLMKFYLMKHAEFAKESGDMAKAKELMEMGKNIFEHDQDFMITYDEMNS